jgi:hypothetical protein
LRRFGSFVGAAPGTNVGRVAKVGRVAEVGWLGVVIAPGTRLVVELGAVDVELADCPEMIVVVVAVVAVVVVVVVAVAIAELTDRVELVTGDGSSGSGIDPALTEVAEGVRALVVGTKEPDFFALGFFFLADGFVTFLRTTRTGVDALAKGARLIEMGTGTLP